MSNVSGPAIIDPQGNRFDLSKKEYDLLVVMASAIGRDLASYGELDGERHITTGQAAEILGVSRRTVTRMLDRGELPGARLGLNHHRSLKLSDVLEFKAKSTMKMAQTG